MLVLRQGFAAFQIGGLEVEDLQPLRRVLAPPLLPAALSPPLPVKK